jgi:hypothetical protein
MVPGILLFYAYDQCDLDKGKWRSCRCRWRTAARTFNIVLASAFQQEERFFARL